jgi:hypothetical protein
VIETNLTLAGRLGFIDGTHHKNDVYRLALYKPGAELSVHTAEYTTKGEVVGLGYKAGGIILTDRKSGHTDAFAYILWLGKMRWEVSTIKAAGALIYNASKQGLSVATYSFGETITSTNGPFFIPTPPDDPDWAMVRID